MGSSAPATGMPAPQGGDQNAMLAALLQGLQGGGQTAGTHDPIAPPQQGAQPQGGAQDPWIQMQQQAHDGANAQWGQLQSPGATPYQAGSGNVPQQNPGGGYNSGEDWVRAQAAAQADSDRRFGPAPGINYMGQTGPYGAVGDLAPNQYVARADQWAANGSGPAIAPAIQQAINEDPRLADLYSNQPIQRINNVGNGFGVLPGALTPGVALHNAGQIPSSYNQLLSHTQANPGLPQGMNNLGPAVAQQMASHSLPRQTSGVNMDPVANSPSFYNYSSPNGGASTSAGAMAQQQDVLKQNPQLQMLVQLLMGGQQSAAPGMSTMRSAPTPMQQPMTQPMEQPAGANPLLNRSAAAMQMLGR